MASTAAAKTTCNADLCDPEPGLIKHGGAWGHGRGLSAAGSVAGRLKKTACGVSVSPARTSHRPGAQGLAPSSAPGYGDGRHQTHEHSPSPFYAPDAGVNKCIGQLLPHNE